MKGCCELMECPLAGSVQKIIYIKGRCGMSHATAHPVQIHGHCICLGDTFTNSYNYLFESLVVFIIPSLRHFEQIVH